MPERLALVRAARAARGLATPELVGRGEHGVRRYTPSDFERLPDRYRVFPERRSPLVPQDTTTGMDAFLAWLPHGELPTELIYAGYARAHQAPSIDVYEQQRGFAATRRDRILARVRGRCGVGNAQEPFGVSPVSVDRG